MDEVANPTTPDAPVVTEQELTDSSNPETSITTAEELANFVLMGLPVATEQAVADSSSLETSVTKVDEVANHSTPDAPVTTDQEALPSSTTEGQGIGQKTTDKAALDFLEMASVQKEAEVPTETYWEKFLSAAIIPQEGGKYTLLFPEAENYTLTGRDYKVFINDFFGCQKEALNAWLEHHDTCPPIMSVEEITLRSNKFVQAKQISLAGEIWYSFGGKPCIDNQIIRYHISIMASLDKFLKAEAETRGISVEELLTEELSRMPDRIRRRRKRLKAEK